MAKLYDPNYQLYFDRKSEMRELFKRMDDDRKLALLQPYEMLQLDGQKTPDVINVTMNEAKVFMDRCAAIMNGANMQQIVFGNLLSDKETTVIENFFRDIYYMNDLALANVIFCSLYGFQIEGILERGSIAARCLMREENGKFIPDAMPLDTRYFVYETDTSGLVWGAPGFMQSKAQIKRYYDIDIRGRYAEVVDFWDDKVNEIYVATKLVPESQNRRREHGLGYPPLIFQKSGAGSNLMDKDNLKFSGESIFAANRDLIPELNRAASIMQTLTAMSFEGSYEYESSEGTDAENPGVPIVGLRKVIPVEKGGGFKLIPINDVKNATQLFFNMLVGALQRGGLPAVDYGNLAFPLSAVAISRLTASKDALFIPRLQAMALFYRSLSQMIKKQYIQAGYNVAIGEDGYETEYSAKDIDKKFSSKYEFYSTSPEQDIANTAIAQQQKALGVSTYTIYAETMKFKDPAGEINRSRDEKAESGDIALTLYRRGHSLLDNSDKNPRSEIEAEMVLQQLEVVLRARASGNPMGLAPAKGGIGSNQQSIPPMVPLMAGSGRGASVAPSQGQPQPEMAAAGAGG
jgi:hypothetical protein